MNTIETWLRKITLKETADQEFPEFGILVLVRGFSPDNKPQYAYAALPFEKYEAFKQAERSGRYDLSSFGDILAFGEGLEPPDHVKTEMQNKYGANYRFREDLIEFFDQLFAPSEEKK